MNETQTKNKFTGESQEQCADCKEWGWPDEVSKYYPSKESRDGIYFCCNCQEAHGLKFDSDVLSAEDWSNLRAIVADRETLAKEFSKILAGWMTPEQQQTVIERNKAETNASICHSHDFCDANQAINDAMKVTGIEWDGQNDFHNTLTDAAWQIAKENSFWF